MKLVIEDGAGTQSLVPLADEVTLGRGSEDVTFRLSDRNVSRRHARFLRVNGTMFVEDLGSLVGTLVNGDRIAGRRRLRDGDVVQIGDYDVAVLPDEAARDPAPPLRHTPPPSAGTATAPEPSPAAEPCDSGPAGASPQPAPPVEVATVAGSVARTPPPRPALRTAALAGVAALAAGTLLGVAIGRVLAR